MQYSHIVKFLRNHDDFYHKRNFELKNNNIQIAGGKKFYLTYNNFKYTMKFVSTNEYMIEDNNNDIFILQDISNTTDCITIGINRKEKIIGINNLTADGSTFCFQQIISKQGTLLLEFAIKFAKIINNKMKLNANKIVLTDNSMLYCNERKLGVPLSNLRMIISGDTFYGKHGFTPIDKYDKKLYSSHQTKLRNLELKDVDFEKHLYDLREIREDTNNKVYDELINYIHINKNMKVNLFFDMISNKETFQDNCFLIDYLIKQIFFDYRLESLYGMKYEMPI